MDNIKNTIMQEVKNAMKSGDKPRLAALRMMSAAFKQIEVDERCELDNERCIKILQSMKTQRLDAAAQYDAADRKDLSDQERYEITVISDFLPVPFTADELSALVREAITATEAKQVSDISRIMAYLGDKIQGRASSKDVGAVIRAQLAS